MQTMRNAMVSSVENVNSAGHTLFTQGTNLLDVQTSIFNLLQACAYRVFRHAYACDYHTHERDPKYPYLFSNYVKFVKVVLGLYKSLNVVDAVYYPLFDELVAELEGQLAAVRKRIAEWSDEKEAEFIKKQETLAHAQDFFEKIPADLDVDGDGVLTKEEFITFIEAQGPLPESVKASGIIEDLFDKYDYDKSGTINHTELMAMMFDASAKQNGADAPLSPGSQFIKDDLVPALFSAPAIPEGVLKPETMKYTKTEAAFNEGFGSVSHEGEARLYLQKTNRILLDAGHEDEARGGCVMAVAFWYETFMPKLLEICSVGVPGYATDENGESELDAWYSTEVDSGRFDKYAGDVKAGWGQLGVAEKLSMKRAWRLSCHYFLGPEKQRERSAESDVDHRNTGDLSQYVAFIDVHMGKRYVELAEMRLTFPYFIGPSTWKWHHFVAERAAEYQESGNQDASDAVVAGFAEYFGLFVTMYPCPYCRHHLNEFVSVGRERDLYPVEYLFVGATPESIGGANEGMWDPVGGQNDLMKYVKDGKTARLFVWKLHNAVSSSISRGEAWYHSTGSVYTNRYWPNLEGVIDNAMYRSGALSAFRLKKICSVLEVATKLASAREDVLACEPSTVDQVLATVTPLIEELDQKIVESGLLQEAFEWRGDGANPLPDPNFIQKYGDYFRHPEFMLS